MTVSTAMFVAPGQGNALVGAVSWVESVMLGTVGTSLAVLAVAGIGFAMLQGRVSARHGLRVLLGCFVLFGAPTLARSLLDLARWNNGPVAIAAPAPPPAPTPLPSAPKPNPDPYAGASVPM